MALFTPNTDDNSHASQQRWLQRPVANAVFDGAQFIDRYAVLRWDTDRGGIAFVHSMVDGNAAPKTVTSALRRHHGARLADTYACVVVAQTSTQVRQPWVPDLQAYDVDGGDQPSTDTDVAASPDLFEDNTEDIEGLPDEYAALEQEDHDDERALPEHALPEPGEPRVTLTKEPSPGESLADVLADDEDGADETAGAPTAGPANVALALAPHTSAVHVFLPAPAEPRADSGPTNGTPGEGSPADAPSEGEPTPNGPAVLLLGPLVIDGAKGRVDSNRKSVATELVAFLAFNPGSDHHAVDAALWPTSRVSKEMRNSVISRTRSWRATDADGNQHLPRVQNTPDKRYRLGPHVTCDWVTFQRYARHGLADASEDGDLALRRALALVRGRPFAGMDPQRYAWAEPTIQEMFSAITDVASELSTRRREAGDTPGALWAARQGLLAVEESETLYRALFLAHHAAGDVDALRDTAARLRRINDSIGGGVEMEAETAELLRNLLPRPVHMR